VVPNTQFTWSLRASHRWDDAQLCFTPQTDSWGELDVAGIFVAGDGGGIAGAQAAQAQGEVTALALAAQLDAIDQATRDRSAAPLLRRLADVRRIRPFLDSLYRPRDENRVPQDDVLICRCEEVSAGEVRRIVAAVGWGRVRAACAD
jgi:hypothetical protein